MKPLSALRGIAMAAILATTSLLSPIASAQTAYEAPLPADINTNPDLCASLPCKEVLPGAESFSERKGKPTYVEAYRNEGGQKQLAGYVAGLLLASGWSAWVRRSCPPPAGCCCWCC